jgi:hypothetical protein
MMKGEVQLIYVQQYQLDVYQLDVRGRVSWQPTSESALIGSGQFVVHMPVSLSPSQPAAGDRWVQSQPESLVPSYQRDRAPTVHRFGHIPPTISVTNYPLLLTPTTSWLRHRDPIESETKFLPGRTKPSCSGLEHRVRTALMSRPPV